MRWLIALTVAVQHAGGGDGATQERLAAAARTVDGYGATRVRLTVEELSGNSFFSGPVGLDQHPSFPRPPSGRVGGRKS